MRFPVILLLSVLTWQSCAIAAQPAIEFISIPAASYLMGTTDLDDARIEVPPDSIPAIDDEQPVHGVMLSSFDIGKYEVTQQQWLDLMGTKPGPGGYWQQPQWQQMPVVSVTWHDTQDFIRVLNDLDRQYHYRLPTEAEWEYVARDGEGDLRPFPVETMDDYAWSITNSGDVAHPVGQRLANKWGVYDMFGNAWEWVNDWYQPAAYAMHSPTNPVGPVKGTMKVRRGGSYHCATHFVRSAYRAADLPTQRYTVTGFRLVRTKK